MNPSIKPTNTTSIIGLMNTIQDRTSRNLESMLPAKVINFDRAKNRVTVQPLIRVMATDGSTISRNQLFSIPVYNPSGGGFGVYFPLVAGNLGWIHANDRDISLFLQNYKEANPNTTRKHLFSDAIFYPDAMTGFNIDGEDSNNLTIQSDDSSVKVTLSNNTVKIKATNIINECENFIVNASTKFTVISPLSEFSAKVDVLGLLSASAYSGLTGSAMTTNVNLETTADIKAGAISLANHIHGGVQSGGSNTNTPS